MRTFTVCLMITLASGPVAAQDYGPIDASISNTVRFHAPSDSVPYNSTLTGDQTWDVRMFNHSGEGGSDATTFHNPTINVTTTIGTISGWYRTFPPANVVNYVTLPPSFSFSRPTLAPFPVTEDTFLSLGWDTTDKTATTTPLYDSSRAVSPLVIPAGATVNQTVTVTMSPRDPLLNDPEVRFDIGLGMSGNCLSITAPPGSHPPVCDLSGVRWDKSDAQVGALYTVVAVFQVTNPAPFNIVSKPWVSTQIGFRRGIPSVVLGTSSTITDATLGTAVFSTDESVEWHPRDPDHTLIVDYPGVQEQGPTDVDPPVISGLPVSCGLWPPNHRMVSVASVSASDVGSGLASLTVTATSNEPDNGLGDGDTANDIVITGSGLGPYGVQLRAERGGPLADRVYAITVVATDVAGLSASSTVSCGVPHDLRK